MKAEPVREDRTVRFLERWESLPAGREDCPGESVLASFAKGEHDPKWSNHVSSCEHCGPLIETLKEIDPSQSLHQFLRMAREEAVKVAPDRASSLPTYIRAWFASQPRWVGMPLILAVLLVMWGVWRGPLSLRYDNYQQDASLSFKEDKYQLTKLALEKELDPTKTVDNPQQRRQRAIEINQQLSQLQGGLNGEQRAELAALITQYQAVLNAQKKTTSKLSEPEHVPEITSIDSETRGSFYKAINQAEANEVGVSQSEGNVPTSYQLNIVAIEDKQIVVQDLLPSRSDAQKRALDAGIKMFEKDTKIKVSVRPVSAFASRDQP